MLTAAQVQTARSSLGVTPPPTANPTDLSSKLASAWGTTTSTPAAPAATLGTQTAQDQVAGVQKIGSAISEGAQKLAATPTITPGGGTSIAQAAGAEAQKTGALLETGLGAASGAIQTLFAPISATIQKLSQAASDNPAVQSFAQSISPILDAVNTAGHPLNQWAQSNPDAAKNLADALNVGLTAVGGGMTGDVSGALKGATSDIVGGAKAGVQAVKEAVVGTPEAQAAAQAAKTTTASQTLQNSAIADATPNYHPKMINEPSIGGTPRVQEGAGLTGQRTVTPTPSEIAAGTELSKIPGYDPKATALDKYNLVQSTIASKAQDLVSSLKGENILRPPKEVVKVVSDAVNKVPEESLLLQKSDPVIANYMRVVKNAVSQNDGTLAGELAVRKAMDAAYANARGKLAFGSDKISALDDVHSAARNALNEDMIAHARSTDVKASLQSQSNLYRASDSLLTKAEKEGGSKIEQLMKAHPIITKAAKKAASLVGLGEAVHLAP